MHPYARLDLAAWRNDNAFDFVLRVRGADLTNAGLVMEVRQSEDAPGPPTISLGKVADAAEGIRFAGVTVVDGVPESELRIQIAKTTLQGMPYGAGLGDPGEFAYALLLSGQTRLVGKFIVLASAYGSDNAPTNRGTGTGARPTGESASATLTIAADSGATLTIADARVVAALTLRAESAADRATSFEPLISSRIRELGQFVTDSGADLAFPVAGSPDELTLLRTDALPVNGQTSIVIMEPNTGPVMLTIAGDRKRLTDGGGQDLPAGFLLPRYTYRMENSPGGAYALFSNPTPPEGDDGQEVVIPTPRLAENMIGNPFGTLSIAGGTVQSAARQLRVVGRGSSIGNALGGTKAIDAPSAILTKRLTEQMANARRTRRLQFVEDNRSQDGTGTLDIVAQGESAGGPEVDIVTLTVGMNDIFFYLFVMNHTFPAMRAAIRGALLAEVSRGVIPVVLSTYHPHTELVNLADSRFDAHVADGRGMSYPIGKASPTAADVRAAIGPDVTPEYDWTGGGVTLPGVGTAALFNDMLRDEVAACPGFAILADVEWSSFRRCLEPAKGNAALKNTFYADAVHGTSKLYQAAFDPVLSAVARGLARGDFTRRYYRGDEA